MFGEDTKHRQQEERQGESVHQPPLISPEEAGSRCVRLWIKVFGTSKATHDEEPGEAAHDAQTDTIAGNKGIDRAAGETATDRPAEDTESGSATEDTDTDSSVENGEANNATDTKSDVTQERENKKMGFSCLLLLFSPIVRGWRHARVSSGCFCP